MSTVFNHVSKPGVPLKIRPASQEDAIALCRLLNEIIEIGGTTAYQTPRTPETFGKAFLNSEDFICCFVAEDQNGAALGFQHLERSDRLPANWASIATFARVHNKIPGVGTALFEETKAFAQDKLLTAIDATIRADNVGGLAYYSKIGFVDYEIHKAIPLTDGTPVDRVSKRFVLG